MNSITLSELTNQIQATIRLNFATSVWIRAEVSELRENQNGHCYLEFIEKDINSDAIIAKTKAIIWSSTFRMIKPYFENSTGQSLRPGLTLLVAVQVEFNGVYGFSLIVNDIDPAFTIGELAARRIKIIRQLEEDGIANMNKELEMPKITQRIAIISSVTAAGYGDFKDQLFNSSNNFTFYTKLFKAVMQGDQAEKSIISALDKIYNHVEKFDVVVIIRGGGATTDLACFDSYLLALNCAQYPLPIIAGIGHQRDNTIVDMVAHISLKTPTAVAEFLIQRMQESENEVLDVFYDIINIVKNKINTENQFLTTISWKMKQSLLNKVSAKLLYLEKQKNRLQTSVRSLINYNTNKLALINKTIETHSPAFLLKHGYSITTINGKRLTSKIGINKGDKVRTYVSDGDFESTVN